MFQFNQPIGPVSLSSILLLLTACGPQSDEVTDASATAAMPDNAEARNMRLVGYHDLQARSAYQPEVHAYGDRRILFVGQHAGEAHNPETGLIEVNGLSILDVTDPSSPTLLKHLPPTGLEASGSQHVQICDGDVLPQGDPERVYMVRTNGLIAYEMFDVTDPAEPEFMSTIDVTGFSSRPESSRGDRETHKIQWECETGIGYFNGTPEGWRVTRVLQAYDLSNPEEPRHIRDFGLVGWEPTAKGPFPEFNISGLHQPFAHGNRIYVGYGSGNNGTLQILDRDKFLNGDPDAEDPFAPTPENLLYPQISRLDMPSYWGAHTTKPILGFEIPDYEDDAEYSVRDFVIVPSEAGGGAYYCRGVRDVVFFIDITQEDKPYSVSTYQASDQPGDYCNRGGRFGPHSVHDAYHPGFDHTLAVFSYFNGGVRAVDIRNPFQPIEVAYYVPETTENTIELCRNLDGVERCDSAIQTNNVNIDDRGYVYALDRSHTGLHILELTGEARELVGL